MERKEKVTLDLCIGRCLVQHIRTVVFIIWRNSPRYGCKKRDHKCSTVVGTEKLKGTSKIVLASEGRSQQMMRADQVRLSL